ncbi:MAG: lysophospholipid acyltransferase family protein [Gammaproteobacteria bacterium]|nr:lysophospholipid acyltransferase family protein [Gammaproteobacteria bacterium]
MRYYLARASLTFFALLPLPVNHAIGHIIGLLFYFIPNSAKRITLINLSLCLPELSNRQRQQLTKRSLIETGKSITEMGPAWLWNADKLLDKIIHIENEHVMRDAIAKKNGVIIMAPHLGCWEIIGLYVTSLLPTTSLYRPPKMQAIGNMITTARQRTGATLVPTDTGGVKSILSALSKQECVCILPDQDPGNQGGIFAPFFGQETNTMKLIPRLAQKTGAAVVLTVAKRARFGRGYTLCYHKVDEGIYSKDLLESATAMNNSIEKYVRETPEQYQWSYKRFKRPKDGKKSPYQKS